MTASIESERLDLVPMTPVVLRACLEPDVEAAERELRVSIPAEWLVQQHASLFALRLGQLEDDPTLQPWLLRAMVLRETGVMVGHIGFHSAPGEEYLEPCSPGAVEFGFTVLPSFRRQGYAREAAVALMEWAHHVHHVVSFVLTIRPDNVASKALAAQLGFVRIGSHIDEVDGFEEILERKIPNGDLCM